MGTLVGHVTPGFGFFVIGLWHLLNHIKLKILNQNSYKSLTWFPMSRLRCTELFLIMSGYSMSVAMELFIGLDRHLPFDPDGTIPSNHLHNFEHSFISITFFVYASFALLLDNLNIGPKLQYEFTQLLASIALGQKLLFHLHSSDHLGLEVQYHILSQLLILIALISTLLGIGYPNSLFIRFVRSSSILFMGVWLMVMCFMLWTPWLFPKRCFLNMEEGHQVLRCHDDEALVRAKLLVNIQFSWYLIGMTISSVSLCIVMDKLYRERVEYQSFTKYDQEKQEDVEAQMKSKLDE